MLMSSQAGVSACSSPLSEGTLKVTAVSSMTARFLIPASGASGGKGFGLMSAEPWDQLRRQVGMEEGRGEGGGAQGGDKNVGKGALRWNCSSLQLLSHRRLIKCCILSPCRVKLDLL